MEVNSKENVPDISRANHVGTRGYRSPGVVRTGRCSFHDDLWVAAVIVVEMALGIRLYDHCTAAITAQAQARVRNDHDRMNRQARARDGRDFDRDIEGKVKQLKLNTVSSAVLSGTYIPWHLLVGIYPSAFIRFLQRITRDISPHFTDVVDVLIFINDSRNIAAFERRRPVKPLIVPSNTRVRVRGISK